MIDSLNITPCYFLSLADTNIPLNPPESNIGTEQDLDRGKSKRLSSSSKELPLRDELRLWNDPDEIQRLLLTEEALTEVMSQTLKHAASSMFVTSFTTSAAFFTNMLTNISFVQVFGVFTGTCILIYFVITVTAIAAFAVGRTTTRILSRGRNDCFRLFMRYISRILSRIYSRYG